MSPPSRLADVKRQHIERVLDESDGNKKLTARRLGVSRRTLYRRLHRLGLCSRA